MIPIEAHIRDATHLLQAISASPRLDAELLMMHVLRVDRLALLKRGQERVTEEITEQFNALVQRRAKHEPIAYITGTKEFWGLSFSVTPAVLIPRPETELLVERALTHIRAAARPLRILELGVGSGAILTALAIELRSAQFSHRLEGVDLSAEALKVAAQNLSHHGVSKTVTLYEGNWFSPFEAGKDRFDLILTNPPYVEDDGKALPEILHEPRLALFSVPQGTDALQIILSQAPQFLTEKSRACGWARLDEWHGESVTVSLPCLPSCLCRRDRGRLCLFPYLCLFLCRA